MLLAPLLFTLATAQANSLHEVVIHTDVNGNIVSLEGVKPSEITVDKLGIILSSSSGVDRVSVFGKPSNGRASTGKPVDFRKIMDELETADPYSVKMMFAPDGRMFGTSTGHSKPATGHGTPSRERRSVMTNGNGDVSVTELKPASERVRISLTGQDALANFSQWLKKAQKH